MSFTWDKFTSVKSVTKLKKKLCHENALENVCKMPAILYSSQCTKRWRHSLIEMVIEIRKGDNGFLSYLKGTEVILEPCNLKNAQQVLHTRSAPKFRKNSSAVLNCVVWSRNCFRNHLRPKEVRQTIVQSWSQQCVMTEHYQVLGGLLEMCGSRIYFVSDIWKLWRSSSLSRY